MKSRALILLVVLAAVFPPVSYCHISYIREPGIVPVFSSAPEALRRLLQTDALVLAAIGPIAEMHVYCAGDAEDLNEFLEGYAQVPGTPLGVVLHPGRGTCSCPTAGNDSGREIFDMDWKLEVSEPIPGRPNEADFEGHDFLATVHIWIGGQIELGELDVPLNVAVRSSGEIERFIENHQKKQAAQAASN